MEGAERNTRPDEAGVPIIIPTTRNRFMPVRASLCLAMCNADLASTPTADIDQSTH